MFTGLIQDVGVVSDIVKLRGAIELTVESCLGILTLGESVAVMGACLTVTSQGKGRFTAFASEETLEKTGLGELTSGARVNLERALKMGDALGGHLVTGHVDARVKLLSRQRAGEAIRLTFTLPPGGLESQIAEKGSLALDGVSLTVNQVKESWFDVMIIPHTLKETTLDRTEVGSLVNIETDILAKYIARRLDGVEKKSGVDMALLERAGFVR
jgi:riboflavin synthase